MGHPKKAILKKAILSLKKVRLWLSEFERKFPPQLSEEEKKRIPLVPHALPLQRAFRFSP
jgi:hypothetical protein